MVGKKSFYLILVLFFLFSCSSKDNFPEWDESFGESQELVSTPLLDEELILGQPYLIHYVDSSLVIFDNIGDSLFIWVDLKERNRVCRFGQKGEGVDEFLQVYSFCRLATEGTIGVYDYYRSALREMNVCSIRQGERELTYPILARDSINTFQLLLTKPGHYLGVGLYENAMFKLCDSLETRYFFEYPCVDNWERKISNRLRGMAYQGRFSSNKSLDRFVYAVRSAPMFMLYSISGNELMKTYEWVGNYPEYRAEQTETYISAPMSADNKIGFLAVYGTEKYVYLLYSGKKTREENLKAFQGTSVYQLTWEGQPVRKFELDFPATNFCVSDDDGYMYALVNKGEIEIVQYSLKE